MELRFLALYLWAQWVWQPVKDICITKAVALGSVAINVYEEQGNPQSTFSDPFSRHWFPDLK